MFSQRNTALKPSPIANYFTLQIKAFRSSFQRLWLAPVATLMTCAVIGIVLTLPMGLFVFLKNIQVVSHNLHNSAQISLYLKMDVSPSNAEQLTQTLRRNPDIQSAVYISPEEGLKSFQEQSGFGNVLEELKSNPLPGVITIQPNPSIRSSQQAQILLAKLETLPNVETAQLDMDWLNRLNAILLLGHQLAYAIMIIFFLAVLLIISHTIRLMTQHHQDEIRVIKLLGGTNHFIRRPFLYSGMLYGLFGGIIAWALIYAVMWFIQDPVMQLSQLYNTSINIQGLNLRLTGMLLASGMGLGYMGSWISVGRYISTVDTR